MTNAIGARERGGRLSSVGLIGRIVGAVAPLLVLLVFLVWAGRTGMPFLAVARATVAVLVTQVLPGALLWRAVRPRRGWWIEDLAMGFAIGSGLAAAVQLLAGYVDQWWISGALMLVLCVVLATLPGTRARILDARTSPLPWWFGVSVAIWSFAVVHQLRGYFARSPLSWSVGNRHLHSDVYLHLSIAGELAHRGPRQFPWVDSEPLGYHYLAHAWIAQVGVTSGTALDQVMMRYMVLVVPFAICLVVGVAALRLTGRAWTGPIASALTMVPGQFDPFGKPALRLPETPFSPTLGISIPVLVALTVLLVLRWRRRVPPWTAVLVVVLATLAAGTKGSTTPILIAGTAVAAAAMWFVDRSRFRRVLLDLGLLVAGLAIAYVLIFRMSGEGLHFSLHDAAAQTRLADFVGVAMPTLGIQLTAGVLSVVALVAVGGLGIVLAPLGEWRTKPEVWLLAGAGLAGAGVVAVTAHPGRSQYYFPANAIPLLALGTAVGLTILVGTVGRRTLAVILAVGVIGGIAAVTLPSRVTGGLTVGDDEGQVLGTCAVAVVVIVVVVGAVVAVRRWTARPGALVCAIAVLGLVLVSGSVWANVRAVADPGPLPQASKTVPIRFPWAASRAQIRAATWIREHSDRLDLVMTNRHCITPVSPVHGCDSRRWLVAAYSERQVLLEGWTATPEAAKLGPKGRDSITIAYWHPALLALNDGFIAAPTASAQRKLVDMGVRWVYVEFTRPHARTLAPFAKLRFQARGVRVYELPTKAQLDAAH